MRVRTSLLPLPTTKTFLRLSPIDERKAATSTRS